MTGNHGQALSENQLTLDREPTEYMPVDETFSPLLHRINQAICKRAVHPTEPVSPSPELLLKWSKPPVELVSASAPQLNKLVTAAGIKKGILYSLYCSTNMFLQHVFSTTQDQKHTRSPRANQASFRSRRRFTPRPKKPSKGPKN